MSREDRWKVAAVWAVIWAGLILDILGALGLLTPECPACGERRSVWDRIRGWHECDWSTR